ncbi:MAG: hypothetical protein P4M14_12520, partial [Gammaproteobacteria bacterium]|nr:hypothetical protein [Gammaproteobacteria bacterium]
GSLIADGGQILVTARQAQGVLDDSINMSGVAQTRSVHQQNGVIILDGGTGNVTVSGKLIASGGHRHSTGGTIKVLASNVRLTKTASIDASGSLGGGEILIGGNEHGAGPEANAVTTTVDAGATLMANAGTLGNGGKIVVWSNNDTAFHGSISATGGSAGGNGGFVETSGGYLDVANASVNLLAPKGITGNWLLDPENITIIANSGSNTNGGYTSGTFIPTGDNSIVDVNLLIANLNSANITITTGSTGSQSGNITVSSPISWYGATTLTLNAANTIAINAAITAPSGTLALSAANTTASITASAAVNVSNFLLNQGEWSQTSSLPAFNVTNNFQIATGTAFNNAYNAQFLRVAGGTGSAGSPYQLTDIYGLQGAATLPLSSNYILNNNIDATVTANWNSGLGFASIAAFKTTLGSSFGAADVNTFSGSFNGNDYVINNLYINNPSYTFAGLFGIVHSAAATVIQNLGLTNAAITGSGYIGGIAGLMAGSGSNILLNNVYVSGVITSSQAVGGLTGIIDGFNNTSYMGTVQNSYNAATVNLLNGGSIAGGIAANMSMGTILYSYNIGTINAGGNNQTIGGITGDICSGCSGAAVISNSYNSGKIATNGYTGMQAGAIGGDSNDLSASNNFFDTNTSGVSISIGANPGSPNAAAYGMSTVNMMTLANFNSATVANGNSNPNWNITASSTTTPASYVWFIVSGASRPILMAEEFASNNSTLLINNAHQLQLMSADLSASYTLGQNVSMLPSFSSVGDIFNTNISAATGYGFVPVGISYSGTNNSTVSDTDFTGILNGNGHSIDNLYINNSFGSSIGFFGSINGAAQINNVFFSNANVTTNANVNAGIVGGLISGTSTVTGVFTSGQITNTAGTAAGFFGQTSGRTPITNSANFANVTAAGFAGGFVGYSRVDLTNVYNTGTITSTTGNYAGGLVGYENASNSATFQNAYNSGQVISTGSKGAILGGGQSLNLLTFTNLYYDNSVATNQANGIGTGTVNGSATPESFAQMATAGTFTGWNIAISTNATPNTNAVWFLVPNSTRPILISEEFYNNNPLAITDAHQLQLMSANLAGNYILANNIDMAGIKTSDVWDSQFSNGTSGAGFVPVGSTSGNFTGSFDGQSHVINGLYINNTSNTDVGLFGQVNIGNNFIQNVGLINVNVTGGERTGGLVGQVNSGNISNDFVTGSVFGHKVTNSYGVGGLVGQLEGGLITNSYSAAQVQSDTINSIGGLVGADFGVITNTFSIGVVIPTGSGGGLIGYADGSAGPIINSYWTGDTSGLSASAGGTLLTSLNLLQGSNFSNFSGNSAWTVLANAFPYLHSFYSTTPVIISGYVPSLAKGTNVYLATGTNAVSAVNSTGLTTASVGSFANGYYYFIEPSSVAASGSTILTYTTANNTASGVPTANGVDLYPSSGVISGLNLVTNQVTVGDLVGSQITFSNATLANAVLSSENLYSVASNNLTLTNNVSLLTAANVNELYTINGSITASGTGTLTFGSPTTINNGGATIASATNQNYNGTVTLGSNAVITDSGNNSTVSF